MTQSQSQNPNQIKNQQTSSLPKVKGPEMNDRDRVNDVLSMEKYLVTGYNTAAWESSHTQLHQDNMTILNETQACHRELFNLMFQKGWYKLEAEDQSQLDKTYKQFSNYSTQFPYQTPMH